MKILMSSLLAFILVSCNGNNGENVIYNGRLETDIVRISSEAGGKIDSLGAREGQAVSKGELLAVVNSDKIKLRLSQQRIQLQEVSIGMLALKAQLKELDAQLKLSRKVLNKTKNMVSSGAATDQKLDELETHVEVLLAKKEALGIQKKVLQNKKEQAEAGIALTQATLQDTRISAPLNGTILNRFVNQGELCVPGMALFEVADLSNLEANIYLPLEMLSKIKLGSAVKVSADGQEKDFEGSVKWISSESEFTPKTILTEETRTTLVYRVKIAVPNPDGILKIGMPVDVVL